ncbi:MotE family protein [Alkalihalobacterium chitinilyticum]|uniref:MotE family protein n=1 Tax=Alkalihalobacterium chitinilyticum TaxID=2980103 RepID=A0ABT5VFI1_9BACI|nr:MotE family protein [Alkalihalobacterium chitinilyticum]MDE5412964.1 MotE family protein [Alkalihalobacterium chitinilyticum]
MSNEKEYSKIQWFFFVIFIPTLFAIILFAVILIFLGVDIKDKAKEIGGNLPIIGEYIIDDVEEDEENQINIDELQETITSQQNRIEQLEQQLTQKDEELLQLQNEATFLEEQVVSQEEAVAEVRHDLKEIAKTYEAMSTKNAANILSELPTSEALLHISQISTQSRAGILAKMDPEKAAEIMSRLANQ